MFIGFVAASSLFLPPCIARFLRVVMSLQSPAVANYRVLASILSDTGASEFLPNFIEAEHDDSCIHSFRVAKSVEKLYSLPLELAVKFVEKCRAVAARGAQPAGHPSPFFALHAPSIDTSSLAMHYSLSRFMLRHHLRARFIARHAMFL